MAGELLYPEQLRAHLADLLEWKNLTLTRVYGSEPYTMEQLMDWVAAYGEKIRPFIRDTGAFLRQAQRENKRIFLKPSWGPSGTWTMASIPIPHPPTPWPPMPPWAPACPPPASTRSSAW